MIRRVVLSARSLSTSLIRIEYRKFTVTKTNEINYQAKVYDEQILMNRTQRMS